MPKKKDYKQKLLKKRKTINPVSKIVRHWISYCEETQYIKNSHTEDP